MMKLLTLLKERRANVLVETRRLASKLEETAEAPRSWKDQLVVNHLSHFRAQYAGVWILLTLAALMAPWGNWQIFATALACSILLYIAPFARWRAVAFVQRFLDHYLAAVMLTVLATLTVCSVLEVFDRTSDERFSALTFGHAMPDGEVVLPVLCAVLLSACAVVALVLTLVGKWRVPRVRLAMYVLVAALISATECLPMTYVKFSHNSGGFLADLSVSLFGVVFAVFAALWACGVLIVLAHARPVDCPSLPAGESSATEFMKSASTVATTALVIAFFGLNTCWGYTRSLSQFIAARDAFATDLIASAIRGNPALTGKFDVRPSQFEVSPEGEKKFQEFVKFADDSETVKKAYPPGTSLIPAPPLRWLQQAKVLSVDYFKPNFLDNISPGTQIQIEVSEVSLPHTWKAQSILQFPLDLTTTHDIASAGPCSDKLDEAATYDQLYRSCEKAVIGRGVKFPLLDTEVPIEYVVTAAFIAIAGCILVMNDRIQAILDSPPATKVEPWIILDATSRSGKIIANAWIVGLAATPWLLMGFAVALNALRIRVAGSVSTVGEDAIVAILGFAGVCASPFLSASLLRQFTLMRFVRRCRWLAAAVPSDALEAPNGARL